VLVARGASPAKADAALTAAGGRLRAAMAGTDK